MMICKDKRHQRIYDKLLPVMGSGIGERAWFDMFHAELETIRKYYREKASERRQKNPEIFRIKGRESYARNRDRRAADARANRLKRKSDPTKLEAYRKYCREKARLRAKTDPNWLMKKRMRTRILMALKFRKKAAPTTELIGCTLDELRAHIASQFKPGMTWENCGRYGWHIDHKIPCSKFDLTDPEQQKKCFHYTNLQPLWWDENLRKGATWED